MGLAGLYESFLREHEAQLRASAIPFIYWPTLYSKLHSGNLDAGKVFRILRYEYDEEEDTEDLPKYQVVVTCVGGIKKEDETQIYLIDHAWIYEVHRVKEYLTGVEGLLDRMCSMMCIEGADNRLERVERSLWKYNQTYSVASEKEIENRMPLWYVMDEFGSAIAHSDRPSFRTVPFFYVPENISYSLLFPLRDVQEGGEVTRDYAEGTQDSLLRDALLLPWRPTSFKEIDCSNLDPPEEYFSQGRLKDTLPKIEPINSPIRKEVLHVYSEYRFVNEYLSDSRFKIVNEAGTADILWLTTHYTDYKELSEKTPEKFINQFPYENILTVKDLLSYVCRRGAKGADWLLAYYNLKTELPQFVSCFQRRKEQGLDNHWIVKPWNLARGLDTTVTNDINCLVRLATTGPKLAQKYIENPVLYQREGVGLVKFDLRYVLLLKSVRPLKAAAYKKFFLRLANKEFQLDDLSDYQKHFTVMNYCDDAPLCKLVCEDFIPEFERQNTGHEWATVEAEIFKMLRQALEAATDRHPPCAVGHCNQSRALYAVDLMLAWHNSDIKPKLLEVNWVPDCTRACQYYPNFYNDIFCYLFLDEANDNIHQL